MLKNSQTVVRQICKSYLRYQSIKYLDTFSKPDCNTTAKNVYLKMIGKYRTGRKTAEDNHLITYGNGEDIDLKLTELISIEAIVGQNILNRAVMYKRFVFKNILYHSNTYERMWKRNNSIKRVWFVLLFSIIPKNTL